MTLEPILFYPNFPLVIWQLNGSLIEESFVQEELPTKILIEFLSQQAPLY